MYLQGFELKYSGKDTTTQGLAITPGLPMTTTPSQWSLITATLLGWRYKGTGVTTSGRHSESRQTTYS